MFKLLKILLLSMPLAFLFVDDAYGSIEVSMTYNAAIMTEEEILRHIEEFIARRREDLNIKSF